MICHLLGNGPSRKMFNAAEHKGHVFGCNRSDKSLPLVAVFVGDSKYAMSMLHDELCELPMIVTPDLKTYHRRNKQVIDVMKRSPRNGESTGHCAYKYLTDKGYTEIHLWGFDSIWIDSCESDTDGLKCDKNAPKWRKLWNDLIAHDDAPRTTIHRQD